MIFKAGVDYDTNQPSTINFIPPEAVLGAFEKDYVLMREQMIYEENSKEFKEIIQRLRSLLDVFRKVAQK